MLLDTTPEARSAQLEAQRRLGGAQRFATACRMTESLREVAKDRIRTQHPEFDERAVLDQLVAELYGVRRNS